MVCTVTKDSSEPGSEKPSDAVSASAGRALVALVREQLPREFSGNEATWIPFGTAVIARMADMVESIFLLMDAGHDLDGSVLVRVLYEAVVKYCWISIDPRERTAAWQSDAYSWTRKLHNDLVDYDAGFLTDQELEEFAKARALPPLLQLADEVDTHWGARIVGFTPPQQGQGGIVTLRGLYNPMYRTLSEAVHMRPEATRANLDLSESPWRVSLGGRVEHAFWWGLPVWLYVQALLVCHEQVGSPDPDQVRAINNSMYDVGA
jgi:hypothetical protein